MSGAGEKHYLIMYRPPRVGFSENATPEETAVIERHFEYLKNMLADGSLLFAGRTEGGVFGIALIAANSGEKAKEMMNNDPAVKEGVFTGELWPFRLALGGGE
jgi:uncharacterized protein YciI